MIELIQREIKIEIWGVFAMHVNRFSSLLYSHTCVPPAPLFLFLLTQSKIPHDAIEIEQGITAADPPVRRLYRISEDDEVCFGMNHLIALIHSLTLLKVQCALQCPLTCPLLSGESIFQYHHRIS